MSYLKDPLLDVRSQALFSKMVPGSGPCETLEGEALRAINKVLYRWFNDGDYWYEGYGCETAGPAVGFLLSRTCPINVQKEINASDGMREEEYAECLEEALETIVSHIEGKSETELTSSRVDMLTYAAPYEARYEDDTYYE